MKGKKTGTKGRLGKEGLKTNRLGHKVSTVLSASGHTHGKAHVSKWHEALRLARIDLGMLGKKEFPSKALRCT